MFCSKCGNQLNDESIFCSKCGRKVAVDEVHSRSSDEQAAELEPSIITSSVKEEQTADDSKHLSAYVGKNADYFIEKWKKAKKPGVSPSWNWAAFFLTPFWLGYRKMYLHLVLYTLLVLITGLLFLESEYNVLAVIISFFYGFYGNTLYYRKANKAVDSVRHLNLDAEKSVYRLEQMGGTSKLGAFFGVLSFILSILLLAFALFFLLPGEIIFGSGDDEYGITGVKSTFNEGDDIYYEADFGGEINKTSIEVFLLKTDTGNEEMYMNWDEKVSPDWPGMYILLDGADDGDPPLEKGDYTLRLSDGKKVVSEGSFSIE